MDENNDLSQITFDEEARGPDHYFQTEKSKIEQWIIKYSGGYINDHKQVQYVLIGFSIVSVLISLFLLFSGSNGELVPPPIMDDTFVPNIQINN